MLKQLVGLLLVLTLLFSFAHVSAQTVNLDNQEISYFLPYPGILPDNPLYPVKALRDRLLDLITIDPIKDAELYLLFSDKRANAAKSLAEKGRNDLAISTLSKAEKYALKIPGQLKKTKKKVPRDFIDKAKLSNAKHKEIIEDFLKELPEGDQERITEILRINEAVAKDLKTL